MHPSIVWILSKNWINIFLLYFSNYFYSLFLFHSSQSIFNSTVACFYIRWKEKVIKICRGRFTSLFLTRLSLGYYCSILFEERGILSSRILTPSSSLSIILLLVSYLNQLFSKKNIYHTHRTLSKNRINIFLLYFSNYSYSLSLAQLPSQSIFNSTIAFYIR